MLNIIIMVHHNISYVLRHKYTLWKMNYLLGIKNNGELVTIILMLLLSKYFYGVPRVWRDWILIRYYFCICIIFNLTRFKHITYIIYIKILYVINTQLIAQGIDYNRAGPRNSCNNTYVKSTGKNAREITD